MKEFLSEYQVSRILELVDFHLKYIHIHKYPKEKQRQELIHQLKISLPELGRVAVDTKIPRENVCVSCLGTGKNDKNFI